MTREQLYQTVYGNRGPVMPRPSLMGQSIGYGAPTSNASDWDMWRRDVTRNPSLQDATADDEALAWMQEQNRLEHDVLMRGNADRAKNRVDLLKRAQAQIKPNLFSKPTNPFEEELQQTIQQHVNAGQRGFQLGYASDVANRKLAQQRLENRLKLQDAALDRAKFGQSLQQDKFRQGYQSGLLKQADARLKLQQLDSITDQLDRQSKQAVEAVRDFGMDPEEAIKVFGINPKSSVTKILRSYGSLVEADLAEREREKQEKQDITDEDLLDYAASLNALEMPARRAMAPPAEHNWFSADVPDPSTLSDEELMKYEYTPSRGIMNSALRRGLTYTPETGFQVPERAQFRASRMPIGPPPPPTVTGQQAIARLHRANANIFPQVVSTPDEAMMVPPQFEFFTTADGRTGRNPNYRR